MQVVRWGDRKQEEDEMERKTSFLHAAKNGNVQHGIEIFFAMIYINLNPYLSYFCKKNSLGGTFSKYLSLKYFSGILTLQKEKEFATCWSSFSFFREYYRQQLAIIDNDDDEDGASVSANDVENNIVCDSDETG